MEWERADVRNLRDEGVNTGRLSKELDKAEKWVDGQLEHLEFCQEIITPINGTKHDSCPFSFESETLEAEKKTTAS